MSIKQEITNYLSDRDHGTVGYDQTMLDANHFARRMFRCWIDGSYMGQGHYLSNCEQVKMFYDNDRVLRNFVIWEFCEFIATEFSCSANTAKKHILAALDRETLEALNVELIDDARDLVRDEMEVAA